MQPPPLSGTAAIVAVAAAAVISSHHGFLTFVCAFANRDYWIGMLVTAMTYDNAQGPAGGVLKSSTFLVLKKRNRKATYLSSHQQPGTANKPQTNEILNCGDGSNR